MMNKMMTNENVKLNLARLKVDISVWRRKKEEKTKKNDDDGDLNEGERHGDEAEAEVGDSKIGNEHIPAFAITHHHL